ncbi:hypothetical protein ACFVJ8_26160 [Streptomyces yangpuensis]|uniref:hypothetical protein n=1 Tax=Streptomyces TaxID=1883 RepID=UPI00131E522A|nr:hypothetical protein [Streptomyces sp. NRRL S-378]
MPPQTPDPDRSRGLRTGSVGKTRRIPIPIPGRTAVVLVALWAAFAGTCVTVGDA